MVRRSLPLLTVLMTGVLVADATAQVPYPYPPAPAPGGGQYAPQPIARMASHPQPGRATYRPRVAHGQYPQLSAPLYPCPQQDIPAQVGGTMMTNPVFAPHELMHEHEYRALYPPFYYRVRGNWLLTPFGMESHDKWELQGTEVKVKYSSRIPLRTLFMAPSNRGLFSNQRPAHRRNK